MSKESTKAAFQKALSDHMLLNLSEEEERSIREWYKFDEPNHSPTEQQLNSKIQLSTPTQQQDSI